jgi:FixJ family two-component response regulator
MNDQTVFVVDDDEIVLEVLALMLEDAGYTVERHGSAESFLAAFNPKRHGCLVLDMLLPGMSGEALQSELLRQGIDLPIVFMSAHGDIPTTVRAIRGGALDFLTKPVDRDLLLRSVAAALQRDGWARQEETLKQEFQTRFDQLSRRERQILDMAFAGMQNKEIARNLGLSHRTIEAHRARIFLKLGVNSLMDAMRKATTLGIPLTPAESAGKASNGMAAESNGAVPARLDNR